VDEFKYNSVNLCIGDLLYPVYRIWEEVFCGGSCIVVYLSLCSSFLWEIQNFTWNVQKWYDR